MPEYKLSFANWIDLDFSAVVYRDQLEEIEAALRTSCDNVRVETDRARYDSVESFVNGSEPFTTVTITGTRDIIYDAVEGTDVRFDPARDDPAHKREEWFMPFISIALEAHSRILPGRHDNEAYGLATIVKEILLRHRRRLATFAHSHVGLVLQGALSVTCVTLGLLVAGLTFGGRPPSAWLTFAAIMSFLALATISLPRGKGRITVRRATYADAPRFVERNRDALLVGSITALLGAAAGALGALAITAAD